MTIRAPKYEAVFSDPVMVAKAGEVWQDVNDHLAEHGLLTKTRAFTADRYARAVAQYENLYLKAAASGPVTKGPNGGDVFNMNWGALRTLSGALAELEDALLISPRAAHGRLKPPPAKVHCQIF